MRHGLIVLWMVVWSVTSAVAQVSIGIGLPGVSIGINLPFYPDLVRVPGYPVYYAPRLDSNFFFYDGMYWVYQEDDWYASSWYSGPWGRVAPAVVPLFILRVPVSYYRNPPAYFRGWQPDAPPRWGQHWGKGWEQQRSGWNRWNRRSTPAAAPLSVYQQRYGGDRYPPVEQQQALHNRNYRYQPRDGVVRQHYQEQRLQGIPSQPSQRGQQRPQGKEVGSRMSSRAPGFLTSRLRQGRKAHHRSRDTARSVRGRPHPQRLPGNEAGQTRSTSGKLSNPGSLNRPSSKRSRINRRRQRQAAKTLRMVPRRSRGMGTDRTRSG